MTKLTSGILFWTAVNAAFVAKPLTSGILFTNSVSFVFLTKSVTSGILSLFYLSDISYSKQALHSFFNIIFFNNITQLLKSTGNSTNLSISSLSTSVFRIARFVFSAKLDVSKCVTFLRSVFVAQFERPTFTLIFLQKLLNGLRKY